MLREIQNKDLKYDIVFDILNKLPDWFGIPESIIEYATNSCNMPVYIYELEGKVVGFVTIKETSVSSAEVYVMGILCEYHRKGIGRLFIKQCEQYCIEHKFTFLQVKTLDSEVKNSSYLMTWEFYKSVGFLPLEVLPLWDESNPCLVMVKYIG